MRSQLLRVLALTAFSLVFAFGALTARVLVEGEAELRASDAAFDKGELGDAIEHARRSATAYVPGARHVDLAYARLRAIALGAEASGQPLSAFAAWQAIRSAALESRHLSSPRPGELAQANQNLARLEAFTRAGDGDQRNKQQTQAFKRLESESAPAAGWLWLLGSSFCLTLGGLALFAWRGLDPSGKIVWERALWGLAWVGIGAACWTLAILRA
ncbi:MAG TPA: hypothetical protein VGI10_18655 [Polyangiaceae bacterium]|jgi:hypothetical protein